MIFGLVFGRFICGFLCPFGFFQDLLHKIPSPKWFTQRLKAMRLLKYVILIGVVWGLGVLLVHLTGMSSPAFCKYLCPQGILQGAIPLAMRDPSYRPLLGALFHWKSGILVLTVLASIVFFRPFCKWICPLGAFYGLFNGIALYRYELDQEACIHCGRCQKVCPMDVDMSHHPHSPECIRCGTCVDQCPSQAIHAGFAASGAVASHDPNSKKGIIS